MELKLPCCTGVHRHMSRRAGQLLLMLHFSGQQPATNEKKDILWYLLYEKNRTDSAHWVCKMSTQNSFFY